VHCHRNPLRNRPPQTHRRLVPDDQQIEKADQEWQDVCGSTEGAVFGLAAAGVCATVGGGLNSRSAQFNVCVDGLEFNLSFPSEFVIALK
jgi:hypothetical protein